MFIYNRIILYVQNLVVNSTPYSLPELCSQVQYVINFQEGIRKAMKYIKVGQCNDTSWMIRNNKKKKKEKKNDYTPCSWFVLVSGIDLVFMILRMDNSSISCSFATCWSIPDREVTLTPISLANYTPYSYAFASISIAPKGVFIFLLKAAITNP